MARAGPGVAGAVLLGVVIVDTYNVIHAAPDSPLGRRIDVTMLEELIGSSRFAAEHVVLVLDGTGKPGSVANFGGELELRVRGDRGGGVSSVHAGPGKDADSLIERLLEREERLGRGRQAMVVSSDKRVRGAATAARAKSMTSAEFLRILVEDVRKRASRQDRADGGRPEFARDGGMDAGRTAYWLNVFGLGQGAPATSDGRSAPVRTPHEEPPATHDRPGPVLPPVPDQAEDSWAGQINVDDLDTGHWLEHGPAPDPNTRGDEDDLDERPHRRPGPSRPRGPREP